MKKFGVVKGSTAKQIQEVDTMAIMEEAQQEVMAQPEMAETAATPQVAETNQPEKVGIIKRVGNGLKSAGNFVKEKAPAFITGAVAGAAAVGIGIYEYAKHANSQASYSETDETGDGESEMSETTENTEES